jgi:hypothetical protein
MNVKFAALVILMFVLSSGCQSSVSETPLQTHIASVPTPTLSMPTITPVPTSTQQTLVDKSELISKRELNCSSLGTFTKCSGDVLSIEFEYPTIWGKIEAVLRTGGYTGYAYDYYFGEKTIAETEPLVAGGRSIDFSEGRGGMSTDFAGFGDSGLQTNYCAWHDLFPICQRINPDVVWMIRFPNANYICENAQFDTTPIFRVEVNLPNNPTVNGFVFQAPFLSEKLTGQLNSNLYPLLGLDSQMIPAKCDMASRDAFDTAVSTYVEKIQNNSLDAETLNNLVVLIHLAKSITLP